ncbi:MAG: hypothetical protein KA340_07210 [Saprospiraceae bacterium]|nr:hypothetical protein [Saprospiraceae bacterium]
MKLTSIIIFSIGTFLLAANVKGQKAFIQSDRIYYAVGERVSGAGKVPANGDAINSAAIKWELFGSEDEPYYSFFTVFDMNGWTSFDFNLPYNMTSGVYDLIGTVSVDFNVIELFTLQLSVVNPATEWKDSMALRANKMPIVDEIIDNWYSIQTNGDGEVISVETIRDLKLLTISVCEAETNPYPNLEISNVQDEIWLGCANWSRELWFYGKTQRFKKPTAVNIIGIYSNEADSMKMTKSNQDGIFKTFMPTFYGTRHYQAIAHGDFENKISYSAYTPSTKIKRNEDTNDSLGHIYYKLSQVRQSVKTYFSIFDPVNKMKDTFLTQSLPKAQKTYKIANYNKFDLLRDFCRENDSPLKFKEKKDRWNAEFLIPGAYAKKFNALAQNPLFIVNGRLAMNDQLISSLKTKDIERVDLFYDLEELRGVYSVFGTEGVVKIKSGGRLDCWDEKELKEIFNVQGLLIKERSRTEIIEDKIRRGLKPVLEPCLMFEDREPQSKLRIYRGDEKSDFHIFGIFVDTNGKLYSAKAVLPAKQ